MESEKVSPELAQIVQPVRTPGAEDPVENTPLRPPPGVALCLSGGGYRAMLFHLGSLWRLNEFGLLRSLKRVSSVSGGSITAGMLGLSWNKLQFDSDNRATNLKELVIDPIRGLAGITIDRPSIVKGVLIPWRTISDSIAAAYRKHLFANATLQDLPSDSDGPRFVINATNLQTKALWRSSKPFMGDYRVGLINNPTLELAVAVAASSAFPPLLSPVVLKLDPSTFDPKTKGNLQFKPYTSRVFLTDGGVYDNLGLETAWKKYETILVSDGGGATPDEEKPSREWLQQSYRVLSLFDSQVRSLRYRQVIGSYQLGLRKGAYWGIRTNIGDYKLATALNCPFEATTVLANVGTRLKKVDGALQDRLINWGYAVCDAAVRTYWNPALSQQAQFPYPTSGIG